MNWYPLYLIITHYYIDYFFLLLPVSIFSLLPSPYMFITFYYNVYFYTLLLSNTDSLLLDYDIIIMSLIMIANSCNNGTINNNGSLLPILPRLFFNILSLLLINVTHYSRPNLTMKNSLHY